MGKAETASRNKNVSGAADSGESRDGGTRAVSFSDLLFLGIIALACSALWASAQITVQHGNPYLNHHYRLAGGPAVVLLNNFDLTPGSVRTTSRKEICEGGSTKQFRHTTEATKNKAYALYGVDKHKVILDLGLHEQAPLYEIDHLISLELGGEDDVDNLWPQPYYMHPGAREKDTVENWLHKQVCTGKMEPQEAQRAIATNWYAVYVEMNKLPAGLAQARLGPEHWQCDISNDCDLVQNKLSADGKPELNPLGCFLAKTRITWILGDRTSMCVKNGAN